MTSIKERLSLLRKNMKDNGISAYLLPGKDPHQSEYLPEHWKRRQFLSGFTGSFGNIAVTTDKAMLWTDGRYEIQAKQELERTPFEHQIKEQHSVGLVAEINWLISELNKSGGGVIGIDPRLVNINQAETIKEELKHHHKISIKFIEQNLVDEIWTDQPSLPESPVIFRGSDYENVSADQKIKKLQEIIVEHEADMHVVSNLESIARLLNIRATDIEYNPLAISYLIVEKQKVLWFIDTKRLPKGYKSTLAKNTEVHPYSDFAAKLAELSKGKNVLVDPNEVSQWILENISSTADIKRESSPVTPMNAIKNKFELDRIFESLVLDGVSMVKTIHWLKTTVGKKDINECDVVNKNIEFRKEHKEFMELSFGTIVSYGPNGAVIHYNPKPETCIKIKPKGIVLIDTGGQYLGGTTDITRTIKVGEVNKEIIENYTRVLRGHINLSRIKFPLGTRAYQLDALARQFLWDAGLEYQHGTGHGVGYYTCVHETSNVGVSPLKPVILNEGMTFTNEPGYYKEGEYGIRIENMVAVEKDEELSKKSSKYTFLRLRQLTVCPYDRELISTEMLNPREINWINNYHKFVFKSLKPMINDEAILEWLEEACAPLSD
jgi:Xaa-Pro aminopeptidase